MANRPVKKMSEYHPYLITCVDGKGSNIALTDEQCVVIQAKSAEEALREWFDNEYFDNYSKPSEYLWAVVPLDHEAVTIFSATEKATYDLKVER